MVEDGVRRWSQWHQRLRFSIGFVLVVCWMAVPAVSSTPQHPMMVVQAASAVTAANNTTTSGSRIRFFNDEITQERMITYLVADVLLLGLAALFAGLTLAIMGLDTLNLEIIADSGKEPDRTYARKILPLRQLGNQLLCTLILGNVMVNTLIAQLTDRVLVGWASMLISTALITLGGEIIPQASMSANALYVGSKSAPVVKVFLFLFFPICKPIAIFLDKVLGTDPGQIYDRNELKKLMMMHGAEHGMLGQGEVDLMMGALEIHEKTVLDVMTPLHEVFMLESSTMLDEHTLHMIWDSGVSRIPVYRGKRSEVVGLLLAKDLIGIHAHENINIMTFVRFYGRTCHVVPSETKLVSVLSYFQSGRSHLAFVQGVTAAKGDPVYELKGIVTLEDIIEELTHGEFLETESQTPDDDRRPLSGAVRRTTLTWHQVKACAMFLHEEVSLFKQLRIATVVDLLKNDAIVLEARPKENARTLDFSDPQNVWLYIRGAPTSVFTLIMSGRVEVLFAQERAPSRGSQRGVRFSDASRRRREEEDEIGVLPCHEADELRIELPSWSVVGCGALECAVRSGQRSLGATVDWQGGSSLHASVAAPEPSASVRPVSSSSDLAGAAVPCVGIPLIGSSQVERPADTQPRPAAGSGGEAEPASFQPDYSCRVLARTKFIQISASAFLKHLRLSQLVHETEAPWHDSRSRSSSSSSEPEHQMPRGPPTAAQQQDAVVPRDEGQGAETSAESGRPPMTESTLVLPPRGEGEEQQQLADEAT